MITEQFMAIALMGAEWVLILLLVLSVLSVTYIVERYIYFFTTSIKADSFFEKVRTYFGKKDFNGLALELKDNKSMEAKVLSKGLSELKNGSSAVRETMSSLLYTEKLTFDKRLGFLGTMGNNAPFIGLFGTVLGIIRAFHDLSLDSTGGAGIVMAGISEALVATAVGLLVAIPDVVAFNYFQRRLKTVVANTHALMHLLLAQLDSDNAKKD